MRVRVTEPLKRSLERSGGNGNLGQGGRRLRDERGIVSRVRRSRVSMRGMSGGGGEERRGEAPSHTYTSDNKKGSIRRWVGGNINRSGETVLEGERQARARREVAV